MTSSLTSTFDRFPFAHQQQKDGSNPIPDIVSCVASVEALATLGLIEIEPSEVDEFATAAQEYALHLSFEAEEVDSGDESADIGAPASEFTDEEKAQFQGRVFGLESIKDPLTDVVRQIRQIKTSLGNRQYEMAARNAFGVLKNTIVVAGMQFVATAGMSKVAATLAQDSYFKLLYDRMTDKTWTSGFGWSQEFKEFYYTVINNFKWETANMEWRNGNYMEWLSMNIWSFENYRNNGWQQSLLVGGMVGRFKQARTAVETVRRATKPWLALPKNFDVISLAIQGWVFTMDVMLGPKYRLAGAIMLPIFLSYMHCARTNIRNVRLFLEANTPTTVKASRREIYDLATQSVFHPKLVKNELDGYKHNPPPSRGEYDAAKRFYDQTKDEFERTFNELQEEQKEQAKVFEKQHALLTNKTKRSKTRFVAGLVAETYKQTMFQLQATLFKPIKNAQNDMLTIFASMANDRIQYAANGPYSNAKRELQNEETQARQAFERNLTPAEKREMHPYKHEYN